MRSKLLALVFVLVACGGTSRSEGGSRGDKSDSGRGGTDDNGGTSGTVGTSGTAGVAAGANGGAGARGGDAGEPGEPDGGTSGVGGATGARGGAGGTEPTGGTGGSGATPSITSCTESFRFLGTWEGNVLDFYFEPLEAIRLEVTPDEELGGYKATLTWGSGDPPPPVTSGDEPYPDLAYWDNGAGGRGPTVEPWPGFAHTVVRGAGCDDVFRVSISSAEPWDEWCSLQEPVFTEESGWWGCTYRGGGSSGGGMCQVQNNRGQPLADYPQWKCDMCGAFSFEGGVCGCDESGCSFNRTATHTFAFELVDDGVMSGPDPNCPDCTVRLERVP